jgi:ABC-type uncharacterized transport system substrate-binding protein
MIILQTNLNRSRAAHDLLEQTVKEENVDVVLVAEPNKKLAEGATWIADKNKDAAIKIYKQTEETMIKRVVRKKKKKRRPGARLFNCTGSTKLGTSFLIGNYMTCWLINNI